MFYRTSTISVVALAWIALLLLVAQQSADAAIAHAMLKRGQTFQFNVPGKLMVKRMSSEDSVSEYLFANACKSGWTSDGVNYAGDATLLWNGTMIIWKVTKKDEGSYSFPVEKVDPNFVNTVLEIFVK